MEKSSDLCGSALHRTNGGRDDWMGQERSPGPSTVLREMNWSTNRAPELQLCGLALLVSCGAKPLIGQGSEDY